MTNSDDKPLTREELEELNRVVDFDYTPEQLRKIEARALRIGRRVYPDNEAEAKAYQAGYMKVLAIARLELITGRVIDDDDPTLKQ
jgi:hypothetical protein